MNKLIFNGVEYELRLINHPLFALYQTEPYDINGAVYLNPSSDGKKRLYRYQALIINGKYYAFVKEGDSSEKP